MHNTTNRQRLERTIAWLAIAAAVLAMAPRAVFGQQPATAQVALSGQQAPTRVSLADAVARALQGSEAVQMAEATVLRARGDRYQARAGFFPKLNGTLGYTRTLASEFSALRDAPVDSGATNPFAGMKLPFGQVNQYQLGLQASQTVFSGGQVLARSRMADAGVRSAQVGLASTRASVELQVTSAYYDVVLSERLVAIAESSLAQAEQTLKQVSASRREGQSAEFDELRAQVARDNQKPVVIQRRADRDLAQTRLKQLLNVPADAALELTTQLPLNGNMLASNAGNDSDDSSPDVMAGDTSSENRGSIAQANELVAMREQQARATLGQRLPSVALTSQWGRVGYPDSGLPGWNDMRSNWTLGLQLQLPIMTGGVQRGAELKARADVMDARARLEQVRELSALDAQNAVQHLESARAGWLASEGTVEQATRAYRIAEIRFREGLSTQVELSDARLMLQQAEMNRAVAARDVELAKTVMRLLPDLPIKS